MVLIQIKLSRAGDLDLMIGSFDDTLVFIPCYATFIPPSWENRTETSGAVSSYRPYTAVILAAPEIAVSNLSLSENSTIIRHATVLTEG